MFEVDIMPIKTYVILNETHQNIKVGKSHQPEQRLRDFQLLFKDQSFKILAIWLWDHELEFHKKFSDERIEIYEDTGWLISREIFRSTPAILKFIAEVSWKKLKQRRTIESLRCQEVLKLPTQNITI